MQSFIQHVGYDYPEPCDIVTDHGNPVLRVYVRSSDIHEFDVARRIQKYPHPNVVKVYDVTDQYVDYEVVKSFTTVMGTRHLFYGSDDSFDKAWTETMTKYGKEKFRSEMYAAKCHMQLLGVYYTAWQPGNCGFGADGTLKISDFSCTLYNYKIPTHTGFDGHRYRTALEAGMTSLRDIDNHGFESMMSEL